MIFCPTLTLATTKDEMKAIRDCQRRHAILRVTILRPWCIAFQEWSPDRRIHWRFRSNATFPGKTEDILDPDPSRSQEDIARKDLDSGTSSECQTETTHSVLRTSMPDAPILGRSEVVEGFRTGSGIWGFLTSTISGSGGSRRRVRFRRAPV